ncbi:histidine kinase [Lutibacter sp. A80]|uniref:sensor histidine kinase n=1 Tax=Lutibacter sp. A80 TaxID=2918453 RepID=UPI001F05DBA8|nr:histidine kinase [Lutibacter sp. A80]UMB59115.1 histidine kinase [Lutibacter sp. A80]
MQNLLKKTLPKVFFFFFLIHAFGQNPVSYNLLDKSDLPDTVFYDLIEDDNNNILLSAAKGLFRYNGNTYQKIINQEQYGSSVFGLKKDSKGKIWCNNIYGQIFYIEKDSLRLFLDVNTLVKGQLSPFVIRENSVRVFTSQGIFDIAKSNKKITKIFDGLVVSVANYKEASYAFIINEGINNKKDGGVYKITGNSIEKILNIDKYKNVQSPYVFAFKDNVFVSFKNNESNLIYYINSKNNKLKILKTPDEIKHVKIYNVLEFNANYWFLTTSGVFIYAFENDTLQLVDKMFKNESITDVEVDFNNNYWFTTLDNGIFVVPNLNFKRVDITITNDKAISACSLENNRFVVGTNKGKLLFYEESKLLKTIQLPGQKIIGNLFYDIAKKQLIVSINASDSFVIDLKTDKVIDSKNKFSVAKTISKLDNDNLFYGNYKEGIVYYKPYKKDSSQTIRSSRVISSVVANKHLFVSYIDGVFKYNISNFSAEELKFNNKKFLVGSLTKTKNVVWLATQHNNLLKYENDTLVPVENLIPKDHHINVIKADSDELWIATDNNLFNYQTKTNILKRLGAQEGIDIAINKFIFLQDKLVILLPNTLYILPKGNKLFKNYKTSKVEIKKIFINYKDTLISSYYKLPYNYNNIRLDFNSSGYLSTNYVRYKYRVKEIDTLWKEIPLKTQFINFNSLPSGTYTVELQAKNVSSNKAVFIDPITFIIQKPFWQTFWFYLLVLIIIIALIWSYFKWRLQQKELQRVVEIDKILMDKKITNLRLENLRSQMNPHFIFNALNSIQDYIVSNKKELASSYLVKFSRLIRMYLVYSQQNEITLQEELNALKLYLELEKVRFEEELDYTIFIDKKLNTNQIKVPSLFIQPYVENALKHGLLHKSKDRKLKVEAKIITRNTLQITIEDNGIGRVQSEKNKRLNQHHKPFATQANKERVYLYKNKLKRNIVIDIIDLYSNNKATGTKVVIIMTI